MDIPSNIKCPHCGNEDNRMIEIHKINYINTGTGSTNEIIYHCEVCSKEFKFKREDK